MTGAAVATAWLEQMTMFVRLGLWTVLACVGVLYGFAILYVGTRWWAAHRVGAGIHV